MIRCNFKNKKIWLSSRTHFSLFLVVCLSIIIMIICIWVTFQYIIILWWQFQIFSCHFSTVCSAIHANSETNFEMSKILWNIWNFIIFRHFLILFSTAILKLYFIPAQIKEHTVMRSAHPQFIDCVSVHCTLMQIVCYSNMQGSV